MESGLPFLLSEENGGSFLQLGSLGLVTWAAPSSAPLVRCQVVVGDKGRNTWLVSGECRQHIVHHVSRHFEVGTIRVQEVLGQHDFQGEV